MATSKEYLDGRYVLSSDVLQKFNPQRLRSYDQGSSVIGSDPATSGPFYVFVSKPDLNVLLDPAASTADVTKRMFGRGGPTAPYTLAKELTGGTGFVKIFTNLAEGFQSQDIVLDITSVGEAWDGSKMVVPKSSVNSRQDGTFQLECLEMAGTPITLLTKLWVEYIEDVTKGYVLPKTNPQYIQDRILDYAVSIYCFQMMPDAETIQFWMKLTGAFPTGVPFSAFSARQGQQDAIRVSIPFAYSYYEAMDATILADFNTAAGGAGVSVESPPTGSQLQNSGRMAYKLKFSEGKTL